MIKLKKLTFNNINSFTEEQVINFDEKGRLVRIAGASGAGKSTIFQSIMYVLKICSKASTILQSRHTKKGMYAILDIEVDNEPITLSRSKKGGLSIEYKNNPDKNVSGSSSVAEEELDRLIGMPRDMFKKTILKKQKDGGFFLKMTTKEMFKFVSDVLDVSDENKKIDTITKEMTGIKTDLKFKEDRMSELKKDLDEATDKMNEVTNNAPTLEPVDESGLGELQENKNSLEKQLSTIQQDKELELSQIPKPVIKKADIDDTQLNTAKDALKEKQREYEEVMAKINHKIDSLAHKKQELQKEIDFLNGQFKQDTIRIGGAFQEKSQFLLKLQESKCPTCFQQWTGDELKVKINNTTKEIAEMKQDLIERQSKLSTLDTLKQEQVAIQADGVSIGQKYEEALGLYAPVLDILKANVTKEEVRLNNIQQSINQENLTAQNEYSQKTLEIKNKYTSKEGGIQSKINSISSNIFKIKEKVKDNKNAIEQYQLKIKHNEECVSSLKEKLATISQDEKELSHKYNIASESKRALKGFILSIFTDFLDTIGEKASDIISNVPNMVNAHIMFDGCKETKDGVMKDEITPIITYSSDVGVPIKSLSGGEETSAELAIDLAVIQTVEEFKNKGADFYILDEPFNGLTEKDKEIYMSIIANMDLNKRVIVVDHSTELNEMIDDTVSIIKDCTSSRIEV